LISVSQSQCVKHLGELGMNLSQFVFEDAQSFLGCRERFRQAAFFEKTNRFLMKSNRFFFIFFVRDRLQPVTIPEPGNPDSTKKNKEPRDNFFNGRLTLPPAPPPAPFSVASRLHRHSPDGGTNRYFTPKPKDQTVPFSNQMASRVWSENLGRDYRYDFSYDHRQVYLAAFSKPLHRTDISHS